MAGDAARDVIGAGEAYAAARKRVEQRFGLVVHWMVYVAVNCALVVAAGGFAGSQWRLAGWGLGLALHTAYVLLDVDDLQDRLVRWEMGRSNGRSR